MNRRDFAKYYLAQSKICASRARESRKYELALRAKGDLLGALKANCATKEHRLAEIKNRDLYRKYKK